MHKSSMEKMGLFVNDYLDPDVKLKIADIGSLSLNGRYESLFENKKWKYIGADIVPGPNVSVVFKDPYNWNEFKDASFDVVISGQTFEHIPYFWKVMEEIKRILKPGGYCCIISPSIGEYNESPTDGYRFSSVGLRNLANYVGLDVIKVQTDNVGHFRDSILIAAKKAEPKRTQRSSKDEYVAKDEIKDEDADESELRLRVQ